MKCIVKHENNLTLVELSGKITSQNAQEFEASVCEEPAQTDGIVIDAKNLDFISSAGLRVLLKVKKRCKEKDFRIINVNDDVMNVFEVTGFSEIMSISKAVRSLSIKDCQKIGSGACGEVFRLDNETIVKLYYPRVPKESIEQEKALSKKAFILGIPTAISYDIVDVDSRTGVVYELLNSKTLGELIGSDEKNIEKYAEMYADVCRKIHSTTVDDGFLPKFKDINREDIALISGVTDEEREYLYKFLNLVPESPTCVHGDLNINNIMVQNDECCLIDMGEFSVGNAMFDISRIVFSMSFAADGSDYNKFYKMPQSTVDSLLTLFLKNYFGTDSLQEAERKNPDVMWLYPLAWFRCCTSFLKGDRWPREKRTQALSLLKEKLIPFVDEREKEKSNAE